MHHKMKKSIYQKNYLEKMKKEQQKTLQKIL